MLLFTNLAFFIFLAVVLVVYYLVPKKAQWIVLLVSSFVFYLSFSWKFLFFILFNILSIWLGAKLIAKQDENTTTEIHNLQEPTLDGKKQIKQKY